MTSYSAPTQLLSEAQLLKRAGGRTAFVPGKGGSAGESSRKVGTGWNAIQPTTKPAQPVEKEEKVKVKIDDYEDDQEEVNMNPQRLNRGSRRPTAAKSSASRWATVMAERPTPSTSTTPQPRPVPTRTASASRQPSGPPSPSQQKASQNGFKFAPAPAYALGRPPSQPGTRRGVQPTGRLPSRQNSMGGGTSASRWATATSASQDRKVSNPAKPPPPSSSRPATQKDLPPHVIAQSTPLPPKPQAQAPPRAPTPEIVPEKVASPSPSPPPIEPSTPDSFSQSVVPPDFSQPSIATTSTPPSAPATVAVESKPSSPSPSPNPRSPSPVSVPTPRAPSPALSPPIPVVESPALPVEATPEKEEKEVLAQFEKPVESENSEKARQESLSSSTKISKLVSPMHLEQLSPPSSLKPSASRALPPRSLLLPDRNRVSSGGARKEKKTPEELEALMAQMRLKNEAALLKRAKAEEDRRIFEELAERERKASEELERKLREERERKIREEKERKERTLELQKEINRSREEAAQRKLALIEGRAWDAEKLSKETRELQYPSFERRSRRESYDEGVEVVEDEEERRKRDGVRNDEGGWETVEHFEGKGRAQLVVKGKEKEENGVEV